MSKNVCDGCGLITERGKTLAFKQFRDRFGRNPVVCETCRWKFVKYLSSESESV